jgi:uncharacterized membrane protein/sporulation protein YlmC with PRC-barrel domain
MRMFPIAARVACSDGAGGESVTVVVNPTTADVTQLVVKDNEGVQRLVPVADVVSAGHDQIRLRCTRAELAAMPPFITTRYVQTEYVDYQSAYLLPYVTPQQVSGYREVEEEHVAPEELSVHRGTTVETTDGHVGEVSELLLDEKTHKITHIIVREGGIWGKKEMTIPLSAIGEVFDDTVFLNVEKQVLAALPAIPVKRQYGRKHDEQRQVEMIARVFDTPEGAAEALKFVTGLHQQGVARLLNAATVVKDADGEVHVRETKDLGPRRGRRFGAVVGGLLGLLAGPGGLIIGALAGAGTGGFAAKKIDRGFSNAFLEAFQEMLKPGTSALIILVEHEWLHSLSGATAGLKGTVLQETLSDELIQQLSADAAGEA